MNNREDLIQKWLLDDLNPQELEAFKALDDYDSLMKLSDSLKQFKAPEFEEQKVFDRVSDGISSKTITKSKTNRLKAVLRTAALLAICFSIYYYSTTVDTIIHTLAAEKTSLELPDNSEVSLNALSTITYNKNDWKSNRNLNLDGEAYFKVQKGSDFNVNTTSGVVTVLGTQFNVNHRENLFEVICFEGSVRVSTNQNVTVLKPGDHFLLLNGEIITQEKETDQAPNWLQNESSFKSMPYTYVLKEFERQYNMSIDSKAINTNELYTGSFVHNNIDLALKAICLPLNITYQVENRLIVLKRE